MRVFILQTLLLLLVLYTPLLSQNKNLRDYGMETGVMAPGPMNAITDVAEVAVGHHTLIKGDSVRTGVTAILPHRGNVFQHKVPAAVYVGNGFGKLAGSTQVRELGNLETPIILTNTLSVPTAANALIDYTLKQRGNGGVRSVNPVVGETNDGYLNDIRGRHIKERHILEAINDSGRGTVAQGNVGAGTGTIAFGFKGGIGTASRKLPHSLGGYTVGVLVQTNFGGVLRVAGVPVGKELGQYYLNNRLNDSADGSCMIIVATDAPLLSRNLERLAKRAIMGLAKTGGIASNGSGDYVIAFSAAKEVRIPHTSDHRIRKTEILRNNALSPLFMGVIEATEEAILNSLFQAGDMNGRRGRRVEALPVDSVLSIMEEYGIYHPDHK